MRRLRAARLLLVALSVGCAGNRPPVVRVLAGEPPSAPPPEASDNENFATPAPRIGAPGGSGAGSRRVLPAQSGNETVGGLPAGMGGGTGPRG